MHQFESLTFTLVWRDQTLQGNVLDVLTFGNPSHFPTETGILSLCALSSRSDREGRYHKIHTLHLARRRYDS